MPLRGFLYAFWTLVAAALILGVFVCYAVVQWGLPFILAMIDKHPLVMDALNYTAPAWVIWGCEK